MADPTYQLRVPQETWDALRERGADWARSILTRALAHPDALAVLDAAGDVPADDLARAVDLARELGPLRRVVDSPTRAARYLLDQLTADAGSALHHLLASGWRHGEVLAVLQACMGTFPFYGMPIGSAMAADLVDGVAAGTVHLEGWRVDPARVPWCAQRLHEDSEDARALHDVARVFWAAQGSAIERALYRGAGLRPETEDA